MKTSGFCLDFLVVLYGIHMNFGMQFHNFVPTNNVSLDVCANSDYDHRDDKQSFDDTFILSDYSLKPPVVNQVLCAAD